jgi:hypothetical protein
MDAISIPAYSLSHMYAVTYYSKVYVTFSIIYSVPRWPRRSERAMDEGPVLSTSNTCLGE